MAAASPFTLNGAFAAAPQEPDWSDLDPEGRAFAYRMLYLDAGWLADLQA